MTTRILAGTSALLLMIMVLAPAASAQKFVYEPKNPAFGGSYLNYSWLLQSAEAQKDFESATVDRFARDPFQDFQQNMQRQILSQLSRELIYNRFRDLDMTKEGRFDLGDYIVEINPGLDGLSIRVFNMLTGDESVISIPNY
jgi:curli production assembly/transport component CsgF